MILARQVLQVKFGHMDEVLSAIKAALENSEEPTGISRVLTDISGNNFTLVIESKAESLDAFWSAMQARFADSDTQAGGNAFSEFIEWGSREFYTIEYEAGD